MIAVARSDIAGVVQKCTKKMLLVALLLLGCTNVVYAGSCKDTWESNGGPCYFGDSGGYSNGVAFVSPTVDGDSDFDCCVCPAGYAKGV